MMGSAAHKKYMEKTRKQLVKDMTAFSQTVAELKNSEDGKKRTVESLPEHEFLAFAAIEEMPDGVMLVDMDGRLAYANKACAKLLGYKADELVGTSALELPTYRDSKDREKARRILKRVISGGTTEPIDMDVITKDGREIPVSFTASVV